MINLYAAWIGFLLGCAAGAISGLFFHDTNWLGGYASWERRMIRLGHISFFGIGFLNLALVLTFHTLKTSPSPPIPSALLIVGAVTMPLVCYLSAWKPLFRHIFFVPVLSITLGVGLVVWEVLKP
jgi:hypothetical protein